MLGVVKNGRVKVEFAPIRNLDLQLFTDFV